MGCTIVDLFSCVQQLLYILTQLGALLVGNFLLGNQEVLRLHFFLQLSLQMCCKSSLVFLCQRQYDSIRFGKQVEVKTAPAIQLL